MLASVAVKYRTGLPASGIKAELAAKVGLAVDGLAGPAQAYDAAQVAG
jgi:nicotinamide mononucleotide (NMN) deamidase PncC